MSEPRTLPARPDLRHQWEPILYACFSRLLRGDPERATRIREVVRRLLAAGADPNAWFIHDGEWLQVALYGAAGIAGDPELTRILLDAGADPTDDREGYHGNEVLYHACEFPDPTCAMLVIDAGARQDLVDYDLGRALNFPNPEMVEMFCTHGARASAGDLHQAVWRRRRARTVGVLLDAGAPIDAPDEHGLTALQIAVRWGEESVAMLLGQRGADEAAVTDADRAVGSYLSGRDRVVPSGVALSLVDEMMMRSIQGGHLEEMRRLLDAGARIDGNPDSEEIPLGHACWRGTCSDDARARRARRCALVPRRRQRARCRAPWLAPLSPAGGRPVDANCRRDPHRALRRDRADPAGGRGDRPGADR
jgi:hypothetical protein